MISQATGKRQRNVFSDLGFTPGEAENLRIRSAIMRELIQFIREKKLTQARAAKLLGVTQPRVSGLMRGQIHLFSIDNLVNLLAAAGLRMDLQVKKSRDPSLSPGQGGFFAPLSIAQLAEAQKVTPLFDIGVLSGGIRETEDVDDFLEEIYSARR